MPKVQLILTQEMEGEFSCWLMRVREVEKDFAFEFSFLALFSHWIPHVFIVV